MAYATSDNVGDEFKDIDFTDSDAALTSAEVTEMISQEEAVINATISNRYDIPVTGTEALKVMKSISIAFVAYRVAKVINLKQDVPIPREMIPQTMNEGSAYAKSKKLLMDIQSGKIILTDAVARSSGQGVESYNSDNLICPFWKRDTRQW